MVAPAGPRQHDGDLAESNDSVLALNGVVLYLYGVSFGVSVRGGATSAAGLPGRDGSGRESVGAARLRRADGGVDSEVQ